MAQLSSLQERLPKWSLGWSCRAKGQLTTTAFSVSPAFLPEDIHEAGDNIASPEGEQVGPGAVVSLRPQRHGLGGRAWQPGWRGRCRARRLGRGGHLGAVHARRVRAHG